jgi:hypothetical protein
MRRLIPLLLVLLACACGVPQDEQPRALERGQAPFRVFESEVAAPPQGELQAELWFVRGDQPVPVERPLQAPGSPEQVLRQLLLGPTEQELAAGFSSALPTSLQLLDVTVQEGTAVVTLEGLTEQVQVPAYAQLVATLDARPGVDGVRFRDRGGDVAVPRGDGTLVGGAVSRLDYGVLLGLEPAESPQAPAPTEQDQEPAATDDTGTGASTG